jgi:hypothetical protein
MVYLSCFDGQFNSNPKRNMGVELALLQGIAKSVAQSCQQTIITGNNNL